MSELWFTECPMSDQGLVRPLVAEGGTVVLFCDECGTVWHSPHDVDAERYFQPSGPDWDAGDGVRVTPGTTRWATREDLGEEPWASVEWHEG